MGKILAIAMLLAALLPSAFAEFPDRHPIQPGALSAEQIQAATEAMKLKLGTGPALELVASGIRDAEGFLPTFGYVVFATPFANFSDRVKTRKRILCSLISGTSQWQCSDPHDEIQMTANGVDHDFLSAHVPAGPRDLQLSVDIADFMYSRCFAAQLKALGGAKGAPPIKLISIDSVNSYSGGYAVTIGSDREGDVYRLEKINKISDGCKFKIIHAVLRKAGVELPKGFKKRPASPEEKERKRIAEMNKGIEQHSIESKRRQAVGKWLLWPGLLCGLAALIAPWLVLPRKGRWKAVATAGGLTGALVILTYLHANFGDAGKELLLSLFLILLTVMMTAGLSIWAVVRAIRGAPRRR